MNRLSMGDLLSFFTPAELSQALIRVRLRGDGTRVERLERLRRAGVHHGVAAPQVLEAFTSEAIRRVATRFGIRVPGKTEMIEALVSLLTEPFPPSAPKIVPTLESVGAFVTSLSGSRRGVRSEADAEWFLASAFGDRFDEVATQVQVPGHFGHRIDIDIGGGQFGVEVKLASAIIESSSEAYRTLGQAFYYDRRRYARRLLVVIVGPPELERHAIIGEVKDLLGVLGVVGTYLVVH